MGGHTALGMRRARIAISARIAAALIDAGQRRRALAVRSAFGLLRGRRLLQRFAEAILERISDQAGRTGACGTSVLRVADGRRRARVGIGARIDFGRRRSCKWSWTISMDAHILVIMRILTQSTGHVRIAHITGVALAHHRAQRQRIDHRAHGVRSARTRLLARVLAHAAEARLPARAVRIDRTLRLVLHANGAALVHAVAAEARRTDARRPMIVHATLGIRCTVARILASLVATRQTERTLGVRGALWPRASAERIARVAGKAVAGRMVGIVRSALRIAAALDLLARVDALAIDARLAGRTVAVRPAANLVAAGQPVAGEALAAHAQRPVQLHVALGIGAAAVALRARIAALLVDARPIVGAVLVARALGPRDGRLDGLVALHDALHVRRAEVAARARALGPMIDAGAQGVLAARVHARIAALLVEARPIRRAVLVDDALRIGADGCAAGTHATGAVLATGRRIARIDGIAGRFAGAERIADHVGGTRADGIVVERVALGTVAADARARIDAPMVGAGAIARTVRRDGALGMAAGTGRCALEAGHAFADGRLAARPGAAHGVLAAR